MNISDMICEKWLYSNRYYIKLAIDEDVHNRINMVLFNATSNQNTDYTSTAKYNNEIASYRYAFTDDSVNLTLFTNSVEETIEIPLSDFVSTTVQPKAFLTYTIDDINIRFRNILAENSSRYQVDISCSIKNISTGITNYTYLPTGGLGRMPGNNGVYYNVTGNYDTITAVTYMQPTYWAASESITKTYTTIEAMAEMNYTNILSYEQYNSSYHSTVYQYEYDEEDTVSLKEKHVKSNNCSYIGGYNVYTCELCGAEIEKVPASVPKIVTKSKLNYFMDRLKTLISNEVSSLVNDSKVYTSEVVLDLNNWMLDEASQVYIYEYVMENITSNTKIDAYFDLENQNKLLDGDIRSYDGGFKITTSKLPDSNINMTIYYQKVEVI